VVDGAGTSGAAEPDPEDAKLVTLARSSRVRAGAQEGAAVRDGTGRTYTAASVELPSLRLSALQAAVVMAASSGATGLEAAALVGEGPAASEEDLAAVRDVGGTGVTVLVAGPDGAVVATVRT
jgi:hypothetical protein